MKPDIDKVLSEYAAIETAVKILQEQQKFLSDMLHAQVEKTNEPIQGHGVHAYMKDGRKSIDHERAVRNMGYLVEEDQAVIERNTRYPDPSIKWANVTKEMGIDTEPFTTQAPPVFTIEVA